MKKDVGQMFKLGGILAAFAAVACVLLALINLVTSKKIDELAIKTRNEALEVIFPNNGEYSFDALDGFSKEKIDGVDIEGVYIVKDGAGKVIGCAVQATGATYEKSTILTGVTADGKIKGMKVLSCSDSAGFGQNMIDKEQKTAPWIKAEKTESFSVQFAGKSADTVFTADNIDGLSGATISRKGVAGIINASTKKAESALNSVKGSAK